MEIDKKSYMEFKKKYEGITFKGEQIVVPPFLTDENWEEFQINDEFIPICDDNGYLWARSYGGFYADSYGTRYDSGDYRPVIDLPENSGYDEDYVIDKLGEWVEVFGKENLISMIDEAEYRMENGF